MLENMKNNTKAKVVLAALTLLLGMTVLAPSAFAYNAQFYFNFQKGDLHSCGPVTKDDSERVAYVTLKTGNNYFVQGSSVLGVRVRNSKSQHASEYRTFSSYCTKTLPYLKGKGYAGKKFDLYGMVDSSSSTQWIRIWGMWCP